MKKYFYLALAAIVSVALVSCGNEPEKPTKLFTVTVSDITASTAHVAVVPDTNTYNYYFDVLEVADYTTPEAFAEEMTTNLLDAVDYYTQAGYDVTIESFLSKGADNYDFEKLTPGTDYYVVALKWTGAQLDATTVETTKFTTTAVQKVDISFAVEENDTAFFFTASDANALFLPTFVDNDSIDDYGYLDIYDYFNEYEAYVMQMADQYAALGITFDYFLSQKAVYVLKEELEVGHKYAFAAATYEAGLRNSDVYTTLFGLKTANVGALPAPTKHDLVKQAMLKNAKRVDAKMLLAK